MSRIIINYDDDITDASALKYVETVVAMGRVSGCGEFYCYVSRVEDGTVVFSDVTKSGTDVFNIKNWWKHTRG